MIRKLCIIVLGVGCPIHVLAQGWATASDARKLEVGVADQSIHRTIRYDDGSVQEGDWGRLAAFVRFTLANDLAVDVNGLAWHRGSTDRFPTRDYFDLSFGAGLTYSPLQISGLGVGLDLHFHDLAFIDQSPERYSKRSRQLTISVGLTRRFRFLDQGVDLWGAPAYIIDWLTQYPPSAIPSHGSSLHNLGAIAGGRVVAAGRLRLFSQLAYAEFWQSETGLSVVF